MESDLWRWGKRYDEKQTRLCDGKRLSPTEPHRAPRPSEKTGFDVSKRSEYIRERCSRAARIAPRVPCATRRSESDNRRSESETVDPQLIPTLANGISESETDPIHIRVRNRNQRPSRCMTALRAALIL